MWYTIIIIIKWGVVCSKHSVTIGNVWFGRRWCSKNINLWRTSRVLVVTHRRNEATCQISRAAVHDDREAHTTPHPNNAYQFDLGLKSCSHCTRDYSRSNLATSDHRVQPGSVRCGAVCVHFTWYCIEPGQSRLLLWPCCNSYKSMCMGYIYCCWCL